MDRPFLSIVVPCYNSGRYLDRGLQSMVDCNMTDLEVILVDDCSTESYQSVVDRYKDKLNIIQAQNDYNSGNPSNGREKGAQLATGMYLTFMDHDDWMIPEGIQEFRDTVAATGYPEYICCGIRQVSEDGSVEIEKYDILPFLHGKFFHMDKFYKKCDLHHKKDIKYQEDNYFTALIACNLIKYNLAPRFEHFCTYAWHNNDVSLGHIMKERKEKDAILNLEMFNVNVDITEEIMFKFFDEGSLPVEVAEEWLIREVCSMYIDTQMYWQFFTDRKPRLQNMLRGIKSRLKTDNRGIVDIALADNGRIFHSELENVMQFELGPIQPHLPIEKYLEEVDPDGSL